MHVYGNDNPSGTANGFNHNDAIILIVDTIYVDSYVAPVFISSAAVDYLDYTSPRPATSLGSGTALWDPDDAVNKTSKVLPLCITFDSGGTEAVGTTAEKSFYGDMSMQETIPLRNGWNFFSFNVKKAYSRSSAFGYPIKTGTNENRTEVQVSSVRNVLFSIKNTYSLAIELYDNAEGDMRSLEPNAQEDSDEGSLFLAVGYGYWIKVIAPETDAVVYLTMFGPRVTNSEANTIAIDEGWNQVGYFGEDVQYVDGEAFNLLYSTSPTTYIYRPADHIFRSLEVDDVPIYTAVRTFDLYGGHGYYYDNETETIGGDFHGIGPGYGLWINVTEDANLYWNSTE